jgi:hypothetical protein
MIIGVCTGFWVSNLRFFYYYLFVNYWLVNMANFVEEIPDNLTTFFTDFKINVIDNNKTRISGSCKTCKKRITGDWKPTRVTSNFISHAKLCTPGKYSTFDAENTKKRKNPLQDVSADGSGPLNKFFRSSSHSQIISSRIVDDAIVKYVVLDMLPLSLVEREGFRFLMSVVQPSYKIPGRAKFTEQVIDQCRQVVKAIEKITNDSEYCCAQADIWSSRRMHGYFGASLSFIHNQKMETRLVSVKRFIGPHTAENISVIYQSVMQQFTSQTTVVGMVTDNAANMVKAFLKPVDVIDADEGDEDQDETEAAVGEEVDHVPIDWERLEEEAGNPLPVRYACMAHTLQLVIHSGLAEASPKINQILAKFESVVASLHKSCKATELLEAEASIQIPAPNSTRWNSKLHMISAIVKIETQNEGILQRVCDVLPSRITLTANDFAVLRELEQLFSPFAVATTHLQSETVVTSSQILPTIVGLKKNMEKIELRHCTSVKGGLLASLSNRCDYLFRQAHCLIATAVDPRFKLRYLNAK